MTDRRTFLSSSIMLAMAAAFPSIGFAQANWPQRAVTLVLPYPAGGATDRLARIVASHISDSLKHSVVVDNRAGATGSVGSGHVARSAPDGYTFLFGFAGSMVLMPLLTAKLPYDTKRDFDPVTRLVTYDFVLVAQPEVEANTLSELIELAKAGGKPMPYATHGVGSPSHLSMKYVTDVSGAPFEHVPYKGEQPMVGDLMGKHISLGWMTLNVAEPFIKSGKLKPIVIGSSQRAAKIPDTPTLKEEGFAEAEFEAWAGLLAPKGTPPAVIQAMDSTLQTALKKETLQKELIDAGFTPNPLGPAEFEDLITREFDRFGKLVDAAGLTPKPEG